MLKNADQPSIKFSSGGPSMAMGHHSDMWCLCSRARWELLAAFSPSVDRWAPESPAALPGFCLLLYGMRHRIWEGSPLVGG